jgi:hypothetical protein
MTIHAKLASPPYLPALVPLPGAATARQIRVLGVILSLCKPHRVAPTRRDIAQRLDMNRRALGARFGWVTNEIDALVSLGFVKLEAYTNLRAWAITASGRSFLARLDAAPRPSSASREPLAA